jgi:EAL domain-containing protein (putative c-di-GMP-specific phosphodiesterase class I)
MLLIAVAGRLQSRLGNQLTVARIGGDIFCVLGSAAQVNPGTILALFQAPFSIDGQDVQLSVTLGLVRLGEHDGTGADALKDADIALKRAKTQQRAGHFYFSRSMGVEIRERVRMMHALRTAFGQNQLFVVYQPQIDLATRRPVGAEALLRWQTPDGKFISPDRFIPIAEYSGLIIDLGEWVLRTACRELVALRAAGHDNFMMSINVSQVQFRHPYFLEMLRKALEDTKAPPEFIELEITESMAMEEPDLLIKMLGQIKQTGVSIAIDDFGTGFSSLSYLHRLPFNELKIDRSFICTFGKKTEATHIVHTIILLARLLDMKVVAEGVETEEQLNALTALSCDYAQGNFFAKPLPADQAEIFLGEDCQPFFRYPGVANAVLAEAG